MALFAGPEYASYIALCRALRLEREFEVGDWALRIITKDGSRTARYLMTSDAVAIWPAAEEMMVWLPRLDQWLAMLEMAGFPYVQIERFGRRKYVCAVASAGEEPPHDHTRSAGSWLTREEACARTWCAVTGRQVDPE